MARTVGDFLYSEFRYHECGKKSACHYCKWSGVREWERPTLDVGCREFWLPDLTSEKATITFWPSDCALSLSLLISRTRTDTLSLFISQMALTHTFSLSLSHSLNSHSSCLSRTHSPFYYFIRHNLHHTLTLSHTLTLRSALSLSLTHTHSSSLTIILTLLQSLSLPPSFSFTYTKFFSKPIILYKFEMRWLRGKSFLLFSSSLLGRAHCYQCLTFNKSSHQIIQCIVWPSGFWHNLWKLQVE